MVVLIKYDPDLKALLEHTVELLVMTDINYKFSAQDLYRYSFPQMKNFRQKLIK